MKVEVELELKVEVELKAKARMELIVVVGRSRFRAGTFADSALLEHPRGAFELLLSSFSSFFRPRSRLMMICMVERRLGAICRPRSRLSRLAAQFGRSRFLKSGKRKRRGERHGSDSFAQHRRAARGASRSLSLSPVL